MIHLYYGKHKRNKQNRQENAGVLQDKCVFWQLSKIESLGKGGYKTV